MDVSEFFVRRLWSTPAADSDQGWHHADFIFFLSLLTWIPPVLSLLTFENILQVHRDSLSLTFPDHLRISDTALNPIKIKQPQDVWRIVWQTEACRLCIPSFHQITHAQIVRPTNGLPSSDQPLAGRAMLWLRWRNRWDGRQYLWHSAK